MRAVVLNRIYTLIFFLVCGLLWEFLRDPLRLPPYVLPKPSEIASALHQQYGFLLAHTWVTLHETLSGFLVGAVLAIAMAISILAFEPLRHTLLPAIVALNAVPKVAIAPLMIIWFGIGISSKVAMSFLLSFFPIVINTMAGMEQVNPDLLQLMKSLKASKFRSFYEVRLPSSLPFIFEGLKIAMPLAVIGAIVGEFIGSDSGLGFVLLSAQSALNTPTVFAALLWITAMSMALYGLVTIARKLAIRWERKDPSDAG
jgi:NitT/TauT family transport system permease protein